MTDRTTRELVLIVLVVALSVALIIVVAGVVTVEVINPSADTSRAAGAIGSVFSALTGIVVGYLVRGGRDASDGPST